MLLLILKILLLVFGTVLGLILAVLLCVLLIPFKVRGNLAINDEYEGTVDAAWLFGIAGLEFHFKPQAKFARVRIFNFGIYKKKLEEEPKKEKEPGLEAARAEIKKQTKKEAKKEQKREDGGFSISGLIEQFEEARERISMEALHEVVYFLVRLFRSLQLELEGNAEIGLNDPADTGIFLGLFYAVTGAFHIRNFALTPNWDMFVLHARVMFRARLWLAQILFIALRTMLARPIRRIWWPYAKQAINPLGKTRPQTA